MATIIEIQEPKLTNLIEYAEQLVKHSKKLMQCLSELEQSQGNQYMERYGYRRRMRDEDYNRYY